MAGGQAFADGSAPTGAGQLLASRSKDVHQLDMDAYEEISVSFSLDTFTPGIEVRAYYPGKGAYWFDYVSVYKEPDTSQTLAPLLYTAT